jgi:hypothetical protein
MPGQETCVPPVIVTFPAQITAATAEQAAGQISAAFTLGVTVVIADLTTTACCDCSAIRHLLRAHRKAAARGGQVRFAIRPGGPLHRITEFAGLLPTSFGPAPAHVVDRLIAHCMTGMCSSWPVIS